jgi:gliding motility-associated-like protein
MLKTLKFMGKGILGLRFISLAVVCGLFWSAQGQDCDSNLGSTDFSPKAGGGLYYDVDNVKSGGPSGALLTSGGDLPSDLEDFLSTKSHIHAATSNPYSLNAQVAADDLEEGVDYDPDTLNFKNIDKSMLLVHPTGKLSEIYSMRVYSAKPGTEYKVTFTLYNVMNAKGSVAKKYPSYAGYSPFDIMVGTPKNSYGEGMKEVSSLTENAGVGKLEMSDDSKTYTYTGKVGNDESSIYFAIWTGYNFVEGATIGISDIKIEGCINPRISSGQGLEVCQGEQTSLMLDREYGAKTYKWEKSTDGGSSWTTISTKKTALDEVNTKTLYRCVVDGVESNTLTVETMVCCEVNGKPASRKTVFEDNFGYFKNEHLYVDSEGNESTTPSTYAPFRATTTFNIPKHEFDPTGAIGDDYFGVIVPVLGGFPHYEDANYSNLQPTTWLAGVSQDHTSMISGRDNSACLFVNINKTFQSPGAQGYKGPIFENQIDNLCTGKELYFDCYIASMSDAQYDPIVTVNILSASTGEVIVSENTGVKATTTVIPKKGGGWVYCGIRDIILKDESSVILQIVADCGNNCDLRDFWDHGGDLAIDDIKFMTCAPPQVSAYLDLTSLSLDTTVCSGADLMIDMPVSQLLNDYFGGNQRYVLQCSVDKKSWKHLQVSKTNHFDFNSDDIISLFPDEAVIYMRVIVASESAAAEFEKNPNKVGDGSNCDDFSISDPFTVTIDCPTCTASEDIEIISSEKAVVENKKKTIHLCKGESVTLNSNDVTSTTEKGDPYSNFLMTWSLDGVGKTPALGPVADELVISWEDATEKGLSVKLTSEDADYPGQKDCMKEAEIIIIADPVPDAAFSDSSKKFCEGDGAGLFDMRLTKGDLSDYTVRWWGNSDTLNSSLGENKDEKFFEDLKSDEGGVFYYQMVDNKTGCKGDIHNYEVTVNPIPPAPKDEKLQFTINGDSHEILTTAKFGQTLDASLKLVWFKSPSEPNTKAEKSVEIDRSVATTTPYEFYIAYQDGDCFSERAKVEVEVLAAPAPSVKDIDLCKDGTYDAMEGISATDAPDYELVWFKSPTDTAGKALSSAPTDVVDVTKPGKYTLYVAQRATTEPYAQSEVVSFDVTVYDVKEPVDMSRHEYCANETAEELKADMVKDEKNYFYADEIVFVSGTSESSTFIPNTKMSSSQTYEYQAYQKFTTPESKRECKGPSIDIKVDVVAVDKPKVNHSVSYVKSEAQQTKEFKDILEKSPDAIDDVPGQTLLWSKEESGTYVKGSTSSSKPYYDELAPVGSVEKQERWVKWQLETAAGSVCESEPEKIDITISSTPAPIVKKIEICEEVFKGGSIPADKEPANNAEVNDNGGNLPDASSYQLVWFMDQTDADASMTDASKLSKGSTTAPSLTEAFSGVTMTDQTVSEWTKSLYVVQSYDDGAGNVTTSPASEMKLVVNATPKLSEIAHAPVCDGPVNLTDNKYWNVSNGVKVDAEYSFGGSSVTKNASNLTQEGEYTIVGTSSLGCKSDELILQLDIRKLSIDMDPRSETCPGDNVEQEVRIDFTYNDKGAEAMANNVKLSWTSEEKTSSKPTQDGEISGPAEKSFMYKSGNFDGKAGDTHTITVTMTDGYCTATTKQTVEIGNGPAGGTYSWSEQGNESVENGKSIPLTDSNKENIEINACGDAVTVDFSKVEMDSGSEVEWFKTQDYTSAPAKTGVSPTFGKNDYGKYFVRYMNHCYAYATVTIIDASVTINTVSDGSVVKCEDDEYKIELDVVSKAGKATREWYKDDNLYANNSDGLSFVPLKKKDEGNYRVEYRYDGCRAELDVVDLKVKEYVKVDVDSYEMYEGKKSYITIAGEDATAPFKFSVPTDASDIAALKPTKTEKTSRNEGTLSAGNASFDVTAVDEDHIVNVKFESDDYCMGEVDFQVLRDAKLVLKANLDTAMCLNEEKPFTIDTIGTGAFRRPGAELKITAATEKGAETQEKGFNVVSDTLRKNVSPRETTTYKVSFTYGKQHVDTTIKVTVYNFKVEPVNERICSGEEISLKATVTPAGSKIEWFDEDKTTSLGEGDGILVSPVFDGPVSAQKSQHRYWARPFSELVTCTSSGMTPLLVDVFRPLEGDIEDKTICEGENVRIDAGSYGANTYTWIINGDSIVGSRYYQDKPTETTTYHVFMKRGDVCEAEDQATVTVTTNPVIASIDSVGYRDVDIVMDLSFGTPAFRYSIDGGEWTENTHLTGLKYTAHTILVEDANGCSLLDTFVVKDPALEFPNWFSPNADGEFENWTVPGIQETYPEAEFTIYDRWGKKLVEFKGSDDGWDGSYNGVAMPSTDYWYECVVREIDKVYTGHFTLIRR